MAAAASGYVGCSRRSERRPRPAPVPLPRIWASRALPAITTDEIRRRLTPILVVLETPPSDGYVATAEWDHASLPSRAPRHVGADELVVAEIYVRHFNATSGFFPLRADEALGFLGGLIAALRHETAFYTTLRAEVGGGDSGAHAPNDAEGVRAAGNILELWQAVLHLLSSKVDLQGSAECVRAQASDRRVRFMRDASPPYEPLPRHLSEANLGPTPTSQALIFDSLRVNFDDGGGVHAVVVGLAAALARVPAFHAATRGDSLIWLLAMPRAGARPSLAAEALGVAIEVLRRSERAVRELLDAGGLLLIVELLLGGDSAEKSAEGADARVRVAAARVISTMVSDSRHGAEVADRVCALLTPRFRSQLEAKPETFVEYVHLEHSSGRREWSATSRGALRDAVSAGVDAGLADLGELSPMIAEMSMPTDGAEVANGVGAPPPPPPPRAEAWLAQAERIDLLWEQMASHTGGAARDDGRPAESPAA